MCSHNSNTYIKIPISAVTCNTSTLLIVSNHWDMKVNVYDTTLKSVNEGNGELINNRPQWSKFEKKDDKVFQYTCESIKQACVLATAICLSRFRLINFKISQWNYSGTIYQWNDGEKKMNEQFDSGELHDVVKATYSVPLRNLLYSKNVCRNNPSVHTHITNVIITEDDDNNELRSLLSEGRISHSE